MRRFAMVVMAALIGSAAYAQDVKVDFDKAFDFSTVKTFTVKIGTSWNNPLSEARFVKEFEQTLTEKGWKKDDANPDAVVVLHGATQMKKSLNTFYSGMGGYRWRGMGTATTTVNEYTVGTLVVDIFEAKSKALIWRGVAQDELSDKTEKNIKKLAKASDKLFKDFPPGSKK